MNFTRNHKTAHVLTFLFLWHSCCNAGEHTLSIRENLHGLIESLGAFFLPLAFILALLVFVITRIISIRADSPLMRALREDDPEEDYDARESLNTGREYPSYHQDEDERDDYSQESDIDETEYHSRPLRTESLISPAGEPSRDIAQAEKTQPKSEGNFEFDNFNLSLDEDLIPAENNQLPKSKPAKRTERFTRDEDQDEHIESILNGSSGVDEHQLENITSHTRRRVPLKPNPYVPLPSSRHIRRAKPGDSGIDQIAKEFSRIKEMEQEQTSPTTELESDSIDISVEQTSAATETPERPQTQTGIPRKLIIEELDAGKSVIEIAKSLGIGRDEVQMIANLNRLSKGKLNDH